MGEYRRGESRSGTSQLGMLVEQKAGKHIKLDVGPGGEQLVGRTKQRAACNRGHLHDLRPLPAVNRWVAVGEPAEHLRC